MIHDESCYPVIHPVLFSFSARFSTRPRLLFVRGRVTRNVCPSSRAGTTFFGLLQSMFLSSRECGVEFSVFPSNSRATLDKQIDSPPFLLPILFFRIGQGTWWIFPWETNSNYLESIAQRENLLTEFSMNRSKEKYSTHIEKIFQNIKPKIKYTKLSHCQSFF